MPNNKLAMIKKLGGENEYRQWLAQIGKKGGQAKVPKGYAIKPKSQL